MRRSDYQTIRRGIGWTILGAFAATLQGLLVYLATLPGRGSSAPLVFEGLLVLLMSAFWLIQS